MIKSGLIARVSERYPHLGPAEVDAVVSAILGRIADALAADDRVELRGLGVFSAVARAPRPGRNLASGEPVLVGEKRIVSFRASRTITAQLQRSVAPISLRTERPVVRLSLLPACSADRSRAA
jgi:nucleoid DNA-binding protein